MSTVTVKTFAQPPLCEKEVLRYAGCAKADKETKALLKDCIGEVQGKLVYKVCYCEMPVSINGDICDFGSFSVRSEKLAKNLGDSRSVLLFGATVGVELDRLIAKYGRLSPAKALMLQAIGAERIEALCDIFCKEYEEEKGVCLKPRFGPGYGDLALDVQKKIFAILDCPRKIGLSLTDSLLMSPSKSVTAFAGIDPSGCPTGEKEKNKCSLCDNTACTFRRPL